MFYQGFSLCWSVDLNPYCLWWWRTGTLELRGNPEYWDVILISPHKSHQKYWRQSLLNENTPGLYSFFRLSSWLLSVTNHLSIKTAKECLTSCHDPDLTENFFPSLFIYFIAICLVEFLSRLAKGAEFFIAFVSFSNLVIDSWVVNERCEVSLKCFEVCLLRT